MMVSIRADSRTATRLPTAIAALLIMASGTAYGLTLGHERNGGVDNEYASTTWRLDPIRFGAAWPVAFPIVRQAFRHVPGEAVTARWDFRVQVTRYEPLYAEAGYHYVVQSNAVSGSDYEYTGSGPGGTLGYVMAWRTLGLGYEIRPEVSAGVIQLRHTDPIDTTASLRAEPLHFNQTESRARVRLMVNSPGHYLPSEVIGQWRGASYSRALTLLERPVPFQDVSGAAGVFLHGTLASETHAKLRWQFGRGKLLVSPGGFYTHLALRDPVPDCEAAGADLIVKFGALTVSGTYTRLKAVAAEPAAFLNLGATVTFFVE